MSCTQVQATAAVEAVESTVSSQSSVTPAVESSIASQDSVTSAVESTGSSQDSVTSEVIDRGGGGSQHSLASRSKSIELLNSTGMGDLTVAKSYKRETKHRWVLVVQHSTNWMYVFMCLNIYIAHFKNLRRVLRTSQKCWVAVEMQSLVISYTARSRFWQLNLAPWDAVV